MGKGIKCVLALVCAAAALTIFALGYWVDELKCELQFSLKKPVTITVTGMPELPKKEPAETPAETPAGTLPEAPANGDDLPPVGEEPAPSETPGEPEMPVIPALPAEAPDTPDTPDTPDAAADGEPSESTPGENTADAAAPPEDEQEPAPASAPEVQPESDRQR